MTIVTRLSGGMATYAVSCPLAFAMHEFSVMDEVTELVPAVSTHVAVKTAIEGLREMLLQELAKRIFVERSSTGAPMEPKVQRATMTLERKEFFMISGRLR